VGLKKWLLGWIIASLVPPLLFLIVWAVSGYSLGIEVFWPGAMGLMALENQPPMETVVVVWIMCIGTNIVLYGVIGLLLWPLTFMKSKGPSTEKEED
jgi:hypothetical protein